MSTFEMKLPDVGEGVAEAEIVEWLVGVGDEVTPDSVLAEVLTDKATVEISSPVSGTVAELHGAPGDMLAVGDRLIAIAVDDGDRGDDGGDDGGADGGGGDGGAEGADDGGDSDGSDGSVDADSEPDDRAGTSLTDTSPADSVAPQSSDPATPDVEPDGLDTDDGSGVGDQRAAARADGRGDGSDGADSTGRADDAVRNDGVGGRVDRPTGERPSRSLAAPAVRRRARDLGIDLADIGGTGPDGRVEHADLDRLLTSGGGRASAPRSTPSDALREVPIRGLRRRIAGRLSAAWSEIPHITYVDAVDVTELESLRAQLNRDERHDRLTILPFLVRAIAVACEAQPELNAHYDHEAETLTVVEAVHAGIATQTDGGLMVPVVRDAETLGLRRLGTEIGRVTSAARDGSATRDELSGSTITITSLGALGGLVTTPIINPPEVAIVGVNKIETRPVWIDGAFQPRQMLNLSSSFDHRMVDGWDAATFVQRIRTLLETPALLFVDE